MEPYAQIIHQLQFPDLINRGAATHSQFIAKNFCGQSKNVYLYVSEGENFCQKKSRNRNAKAEKLHPRSEKIMVETSFLPIFMPKTAFFSSERNPFANQESSFESIKSYFSLIIRYLRKNAQNSRICALGIFILKCWHSR